VPALRKQANLLSRSSSRRLGCCYRLLPAAQLLLLLPALTAPQHLHQQEAPPGFATAAALPTALHQQQMQGN
jgi:hypothetical protein